MLTQPPMGVDITGSDDRVLLLSVHPRHVEAILEGRKRFEIRRRRPRAKFPLRCLLHATGKGIMGECTIEAAYPLLIDGQAVLDRSEAASSKVEAFAGLIGLTVTELLDYLYGAVNPTAMFVSSPRRYKQVVDDWGIRMATCRKITMPQSWRYLTAYLACRIAMAGSGAFNFPTTARQS